MHFFTAVASVLLAAEAVMATPVTLVPRTPRANRRGTGRSTRPMEAVTVISTEATGPKAASASTNTSHTAYSTNWAGAVLIGTGYTSVTGTFTVPTPKAPTGADSSTEYSASAWVGLDGDTCSTAILQTGVDFSIQGSTTSFTAWYEWYPDYAYNFDGFAISAGNSIRLTATASSKSSGSVKVENLSTGKSVTHSFSGESNELCETNAEWIVEDFEQGGSLVPLVNFGTVTFSDCSVTASGSSIGVTGSTIINLRQNNVVLTDCSTSGSSKVSCTYK